VDYTRSPATSGSGAIDTNYFTCTVITNEANESDYPYFWASTILLDGAPAPSGTYVSFGRAMGCMNGSWMDVHGAGSQKSDILTGNPATYPYGRGPQGDAVRIYNYVRLVRGGLNDQDGLSGWNTCAFWIRLTYPLKRMVAQADYRLPTTKQGKCEHTHAMFLRNRTTR
jgi:hypothetical protein